MKDDNFDFEVDTEDLSSSSGERVEVNANGDVVIFGVDVVDEVEGAVVVFAVVVAFVVADVVLAGVVVAGVVVAGVVVVVVVVAGVVVMEFVFTS